MHFINGFCASNNLKNETDVFIIILNDGCCMGVRGRGMVGEDGSLKPNKV